ncbi:MAG: response regulator [Parafilimonas sp.]|nr:response regulator [Parafilimonas sp.]
MCSKVIAIIDDDEVFQLLTKKMIEHENIADKVLQFSDPTSGLSFFKTNANDFSKLPSVIFLDLYMPQMNGWQFLSQLENLHFPHKYEPSVFLVSGADSIDFEKMRKYRLIKGYLSKPVPMTKLISLIESAEVIN